MAANELILGEHRRTLDERFRLSLPPELAESLGPADATCILAKERAGCLSLWNADRWQARLTSGKELLEAKVRAGRLDARLEELQLLGRLLSSRHTSVQLAGRGRLVVPEGFREFLGVEPGGEVMIVGAAVSIEIWRLEAWTAYLNERMPEFRRLFDDLSG
jgi:MraZ protein